MGNSTTTLVFINDYSRDISVEADFEFNDKTHSHLSCEKKMEALGDELKIEPIPSKNLKRIIVRLKTSLAVKEIFILPKSYKTRVEILLSHLLKLKNGATINSCDLINSSCVVH